MNCYICDNDLTVNYATLFAPLGKYDEAIERFYVCIDCWKGIVFDRCLRYGVGNK